MRIGMMTDAYRPHISGITNYIALYKQFLEQAGHDVFVFTFGDMDFQDDEKNVIRSPGLPLSQAGYFLTVRHNRKAQQVLRTMDIIHVHHPFLSGRLAIRYGQSRGIPVIFTNHTRYDLYARVYMPVVPDEITDAFLRAYMPSFCRSVDLVIAPSNGLKKILVKLGVDAPITVLPNGVDLSRLKEDIQEIRREELGFKKDTVIFIFVGRLGGEKNLVFLLRAFGGIANTYENVGLLLVGDGPERENLQDRVQHMGLESRVHFSGMVPYADIPSYLKTADVFVTASVTEVHPLSVIEAMSVGLPVVGIESPGVGDTVINGETGYLAPQEDLAIFATKMGRLVSEPDLRRQMGCKAEQAAEQYAIERTVHSLLEQYQMLVEHSVPRKRSIRTRLLRILDRWMP